MNTGSRFSLYPFDYAHFPELTDLWIASWQHAMPSIDFEQRRSWFVEHLKSLRECGHQVWLAFDSANGDLAGFFTLHVADGAVDQLAVLPRYWGTHVAKILIGHAKSLVSARGSGCLTLDVNQDNHRAVRFYEREGFERSDEGTNPRSGLSTWRYVWRGASSQ